MPFFNPYYAELRRAERDDIASRAERVERVVAERDRVRDLLELRPTVSAVDVEHYQRLESFADRLIRENIEKQSETERTNRWKNIALSRLERARREDEASGRSISGRRREAAPVAPGLDPSAFTGVARTVFGNDAWVGSHDWRSVSSLPRFLNPGIAYPCIQRVVRREVMFALRKAGKGHRVKHRRGPFTGVPC